MLLSRHLKLVRFVRKYSTEKLWQEVSIPVPWGEIRGKWWGRTDIRPVLTLHGWQDNCGTFDRLIPLLRAKKLGFLAIDLPGHGYSSRTPPGIPYDSNTFVLTIKHIQQHFEWRKLSLLAHSMGGFLAYTYAMYYPDRVDFLALFDSIWVDDAVPVKAERLESFVKNNAFAFAEREPPSYSVDQLRQMLSLPNGNSIALELTDFILKRNIAASALNPGKYYFTRDPRLKSFDEVYCLREEFKKFTPTIACPVFLVRFKQSFYGDRRQFYHGVAEILKKSNSRAECLLLEGTHHGHLNAPEKLAGLLREFIDKYSDLEEREPSGLKREDLFMGHDPRIDELNI